MMCRLRSRIVLLVAFALVLRSLLAPGVMLDHDGERDTFTVAMCTGHGLETITLDANGKPVKPVQIRHDGGLCPYASSAPIAAALPLAEAPLPIFTTKTAAYFAIAAHIPAARSSGSESARGPPLSA